MTDQTTEYQHRHSIHRNDPNVPAFKFIRRQFETWAIDARGAGEQWAAQAEYEHSVADTVEK
jgi:hypothetical protein